MPSRSSLIVYYILLTGALASGCGEKEPERPAADATSSAEETAPAPTSEVQAAAGNPTAAPLTVADIDRWERGMAGEMEAVEEAAARLKSARTNEDTLGAMMGVQEMTTKAAGARAAGLEEERYQFVRSNLSSVVAYLAPPMMDTTEMPQSMRDEIRTGRERQLQRMSDAVPAEVVAALKPRAVELRKKSLELVGARLKGAGMQ